MDTDPVMRPPPPPGPYLVVGLARSGQAIARALTERGERVVGIDSGNPPGVEGLRDLGVEVLLDDDGLELPADMKTVVKSPGVPSGAAPIVAAREADLEVVSELEVAWRLIGNPFVAVTGTNGKTTVAEWLGHVWREAGRPVEVAGNVGTPVSSLIGSIDEEAVVICECSSFQLEDSRGFAPEIAVLLNLTPDHLDRHGSLEAYRDAKLEIFARQSPDDFAIFDADLVPFAASGRPGRGATIAYGASACSEGRGCLVRRRGDRIEVDGEPLIALADLALAGEHNVRNAMAVAAAALCAKIPREAIVRALGNFPGVPHRLEPVAKTDGVCYVNDSKATNVAAADAALRAYEAPVRAILGGSLKGGGFEELAEPVSECAASVYLVGEAAGALREALWGAGVPITESGTLEQAVADASSDAEPGDVVLLAPACASFDAFSDYEERGERFRELVRGLG